MTAQVLAYLGSEDLLGRALRFLTVGLPPAGTYVT